ncbi:PadR family transcriptional regulator [Acidobacteriota bacterium]
MNRLLTRSEEFLLLAVIRLGDNAYPVSVFDEISEATGSTWTLGAIYFPLQRLEERGFLSSFLGDPSTDRGGKSKRFYKVTKEGLEALDTARKAQDKMWKGVECIKTK